MVSKDKIAELYEESPSHLHHKVRGECRDTYDHIREEFTGDTFSEKAYQYAHGKRERWCNRCGDPCSFRSFGEGYSGFCSDGCRALWESEEKNGRECKVCGSTFRVTTRNDKSEHQFWCSQACLKEFLEGYSEKRTKKELEELDFEGARQPYFRAWREAPEAAAWTEFCGEGETFAEKLRALLHPREAEQDRLVRGPQVDVNGRGFGI